MAFIAIHQEYDLSSTVIADSIQTNPAFVRQIMMKLKKAGLMSSVNGHAKPSLAKPTEEITLLDIYNLNSALNYNEEGTGTFILNALKIAL